ncbi:hypothetical protein FVE85_3751 [Porphyridium purpureum]|uniref:Uncharacterized protein n=1 Tax=Porphyridium purpureum TaxID=35688 RepID=A0A5J4YNM8_PORPP|nr:hypothetical protein FVE85_8943 [Porphyridium purpureum]KAA8492313.1 hypothetical protein FVE85_3751 [Porphyridium purpureum]|eukprot:POR2474..scf249_10
MPCVRCPSRGSFRDAPGAQSETPLYRKYSDHCTLCSGFWLQRSVWGEADKPISCQACLTLASGRTCCGGARRGCHKRKPGVMGKKQSRASSSLAAASGGLGSSILPAAVERYVKELSCRLQPYVEGVSVAGVLKWLLAALMVVVLVFQDRLAGSGSAFSAQNQVMSHDNSASMGVAENRADVAGDQLLAGITSSSGGNGSARLSGITIQDYKDSVTVSDEDMQRTERMQAEARRADMARIRQLRKVLDAEDSTARGENIVVQSRDDSLTHNVPERYMYKVVNGTRLHFTGLDFGLVRGVNVTKVSSLMYKWIKQLGVKSLADYPCTDNAVWMPQLLAILDFEIRNFKYYCLDDDHEQLRQLEVSDSFTGAGLPEFIPTDVRHFKHFPTNVDMVFSWNGLQKYAEHGIGVAWNLVQAVKREQVTYMVVGNSQGGHNLVQGEINLKDAPFKFDDPIRHADNVTDEPDRGVLHPKQLLAYKVGAEKRVTLSTILQESRVEKKRLGSNSLEEEEV